MMFQSRNSGSVERTLVQLQEGAGFLSEVSFNSLAPFLWGGVVTIRFKFCLSPSVSPSYSKQRTAIDSPHLVIHSDSLPFPESLQLRGVKSLCPVSCNNYLQMKPGKQEVQVCSMCNICPLSVCTEFPRGKHLSDSNMNKKEQKGEWGRNCGGPAV